MLHRQFCRIFLIVVLFCLHGTLIASSLEEKEVYQDLSLRDLLEFKLSSGSFLQLDLKKTPGSITIITEEMLKVSGARNLTEVLEIFVPGFIYGYNKWNGTLWGMRGVFSDRNTKVLCLVNGHKMNPQSRDGYQAETVLGDLGDIRQIEVLRGPASLVYGSGAIAGIVNILTKSAKDGYESDVSLRYDNRNTIEPQINIYMKPDDNNFLTFTTGFRRSNGIPEAKTNIYGLEIWPFPDPAKVPYQFVPHNGIPSDGSFDNPAGNWKISGEWAYKEYVKLYSRMSHQEENVGAWFPYDPWPEVVRMRDFKDTTLHGGEDNLIPARNIGAGTDGPKVEWTHPFWSQVESWGSSLRQYVIDNMMADLQLKIPLSGNELSLTTGFDGYASKILYERRPSYSQVTELNDRGDKHIESEFGEFRYSAAAMYHLQTIPKLQLASGVEYRQDVIGKGLFCGNSNSGQTGRKVVEDVTYHTFTIVSEGLYDFSKKVRIQSGLRADFHSRATLINGKIAGIFTLFTDHTIKLIAQSSSNNGGADEYEYNRNHFKDGNTVESGRVVFNDIYKKPDDRTPIFVIPTIEQMHKLKQEKAYSLEIDYVGQIMEVLTLTPSFSVTKIKNLFTWDQMAFRQINCDGYNFLNADLEANIKIGTLTIGSSHSFTRLFNTDVNKGEENYYPFWDSSKIVYHTDTNSYGNLEYYPDTTHVIYKKDTTYLIKKIISADGKKFKNFPSNMTKLYCTYSPVKWMTLHTNARIWWGLDGRYGDPNATDSAEQMLAYQEKNGFNVFGAGKDPIVKLNASILLHLPKEFSIGVYANDILGIDHGPYYYNNSKSDNKYIRNTLRFQQAEQYAMTSQDQQLFSVTITKTF